MKKVKFFNKDRKLLMVFENFKFITTEALNIIAFTGMVNFDFFSLQTTFEAEEYDFRNLIISLEKMHERKLKHITFYPFSGKIKITFSEDIGNINAKVEIHNDLSTGKLEFEYHLDQSFISELLTDIREVMKRENI